MLKVWETAGVCLLALVMTEIYLRSRRPKLYAFVNIAAGCAALIFYKLVLCPGDINLLNASVAAVLGVPGVVLCAGLGAV